MENHYDKRIYRWWQGRGGILAALGALQGTETLIIWRLASWEHTSLSPKIVLEFQQENYQKCFLLVVCAQASDLVSAASNSIFWVGKNVLSLEVIRRMKWDNPPEHSAQCLKEQYSQGTLSDCFISDVMKASQPFKSTYCGVYLHKTTTQLKRHMINLVWNEK